MLKTVGAALVPRLLGLAISLFGVYFFFFAEPTSHVVVINRELGIGGAVTVRSESRGYRICLDSSRVPYSFDEFANEQLAPTRGSATTCGRATRCIKPRTLCSWC